LKAFFHSIVDDGYEMDEEALAKFAKKTPKKMVSNLQYTLKTLHAALEQTLNCSFITECFSSDAKSTLFFLYYTEESVPSSIPLEKSPYCLLVVGDFSYYPFDVTVNMNDYRLHAVFDNAKCIYFEGDVWKEWNGDITTEVLCDNVCKVAGTKALSYVRV